MRIKIDELDMDYEVHVGRLVMATLVCLGIIAALIAVFSCWVVVPAGSVGVGDTFGSVSPGVFTSGFQFKMPVESVAIMNTQTQNLDMVGQNDMASLTSEGVTVNIDLTVLYHIDGAKAPDLYRTVGTDYVSTIIVPEIRGDLRTEIAKYNASTIYSEERGQIAANAIIDLNAKLNARGIYVDDFIIRQVLLPQSIQDAINAKQQAEQQIQQQQYQVQIEEAKAQQRIVDATGIATANQIIQSNLTQAYLQYEMIQAMQGSNLTVVITNGDQLQMNKFV